MKTGILFPVSICVVCFDRRRAYCTLLLSSGGNAGAEAIFLYWGRTVPCGIQTMAIASVLNFSNNMLFVMPVTVICAVLLLRTGQSTKIKGDAAIAMISVGALAVGYLLMNIFPQALIFPEMCSSLFGSTSIDSDHS